MMSPENDSSPIDKGTSQPLEATGFFRAEQIQALNEHWIDTVEQFVSVTATTEGRDGMRRLLDIDERELQDLLEQTSKSLPAQMLDELSTPSPGGELGAILIEPTEEVEHGKTTDDQEGNATAGSQKENDDRDVHQGGEA